MRSAAGWVTPRRAALVVLVGAVGWLLVAVVRDLAESGQRRSGTNYIDVAHFVVDVGPRQTLCQLEGIPANTGGIRMLPTDYHQPTPPMRLFVRDRGGTILTSTYIKPGWVEGMNDFQFPPIRRNVTASVCLRDLGKVHVTIAGENVPPDAALTVDGQPTTSRIFLQYLRPGRESYLDIGPLVLGRLRQGKAGWFGPWMPALVVLLILGCLATTVFLARRECA